METRLRGNTFLLLLLRAGRQELSGRSFFGESNKITRPNMFADLIRMTNPAYEPPSMSTLGQYFSKYMDGTKPFSQKYYPFNSVLYRNGLNERLREERWTVQHEMDAFCKTYLQMASPIILRNLVAGIVDAILEDDSFRGEFDVGEMVADKDALENVEAFILQPFLVSVWNHILLNHPNSAEGRDTYFSWTSDGGFRTPRIVSTNIGENRAKRITVSAELPYESPDDTAEDKPIAGHESDFGRNIETSAYEAENPVVEESKISETSVTKIYMKNYSTGTQIARLEGDLTINMN